MHYSCLAWIHFRGENLVQNFESNRIQSSRSLLLRGWQTDRKQIGETRVLVPYSTVQCHYSTGASQNVVIREKGNG